MIPRSCASCCIALWGSVAAAVGVRSVRFCSAFAVGFVGFVKNIGIDLFDVCDVSIGEPRDIDRFGSSVCEIFDSDRGLCNVNIDVDFVSVILGQKIAKMGLK